MKSFFQLGLLFFFFATSSFVFGQCGTLDKPNEEWLKEMELTGGRPYLAPDFIRQRSGKTIYIPIHYHIVRRSDKTGGYSPYFLIRNHCDLNERYKDTRFVFVLDTISYIDNTSLYSITNSNERTLNQFNTSKHCNVYFVDNPNGACGYTYRPNIFRTSQNRSAIYIKGSKTNTSCSGLNSTTLIHEMGHWLDLPHTFSGWEGLSYSSSTNTLNPGLRENAVRTGQFANCTSRGDLFCDTDPDYLSDRWNCSVNNPTFVDPRGTSFVLNGSNFMSYSNDGCQTEFSQQQKDHMDTKFETFNERKDMALYDYSSIPSISSISNTIPENSTTDRLLRQNLTLSFNRVGNAQGYFIILSRGSNTYSSDYNFPNSSTLVDTFIKDTFLNISNYLSNVTNQYLYWQVIPYNKMNFCLDNASKINTFRLSSITNINFEVIKPECPNNIENSGLKVIGTPPTNFSFKLNGQLPFTQEIFGIDNGVNFIEITNTTNNEITKYYFNSGIPDFSHTIEETNTKITINVSGGTPPYQYQWNNSAATNKNFSDKPVSDVTILDKNLCTYKVTFKSNALSDLSEKEFELYPTLLKPNESLYIKGLDFNSSTKIQCFNALMQLCELPSELISDHTIKLSTLKLSSGIYFLRIDNKSYKFIIQ
ncbi:MAG: M43 family zinc metalloprotease [Chitinophagales bacterium]|nr:M43 family zinc metalloprotease [Chitinophagales bacterium]